MKRIADGTTTACSVTSGSITGGAVSTSTLSTATPFSVGTTGLEN